MVELQAGNPQITDAGATLWAVNFDNKKTLKKVKETLKISFPLLADDKSKTIDAYGVRNHTKKDTELEGIAHPTIFIIDQGGKITASFAFGTVGKRHGTKDIIKALK